MGHATDRSPPSRAAPFELFRTGREQISGNQGGVVVLIVQAFSPYSLAELSRVDAGGGA